MKKVILFACLLFCNGLCKSQIITANSGWNISIPSNTITEAGRDYTVDATSATSQTLLNLASLNSTYTVRVHKVDTDWHSNLTLWVDRTGNGTGSVSGTITGGTTPFQLSSSPVIFFSGTRGGTTSRTNIPIQYEIRGLSVLIPVKTYTTTVVYTISN